MEVKEHEFVTLTTSGTPKVRIGKYKQITVFDDYTVMLWLKASLRCLRCQILKFTCLIFGNANDLLEQDQMNAI